MAQDGPLPDDVRQDAVAPLRATATSPQEYRLDTDDDGETNSESGIELIARTKRPQSGARRGARAGTSLPSLRARGGARRHRHDWRDDLPEARAQ
eukprot:16444367-Heterocapsa_arctica.AAC.1